MSNRIKSGEIQIGNSYVLPIEQSNVTLQQAKVKKIIEELPRWSGEWDIEIDENKYYLVTNSYFDTQYDVWETDWVYLDIEVEEDEDE